MSKDYLHYNDLAKDLTPDSKVFYVNGCSMTYGQELYGISQYTDVHQKFDFMPDDYHHERLKRCWAGVMKENLFPDHLFFNAGMGGSSNHRIFRTTAYHITSMLQAGVKPENIFVSIMFTNSSRLGLYDKNVKRWVDVFLSLEYPEDQSYYNDLTENYLKNFTSTYSLAEDALSMIIQMQCFLKAFGIKYAFIEGIPIMLLYGSDKNYARISEHPVFKAIDMSRWAFFDQSFVDKTQAFWCTNFGSWSMRNEYDHGSGGHPLEDAHRNWGLKMVEHIQKNKESYL